MLKVNSYSAKGTKLGGVSLPKEFEAKDLPAGKAGNLRLLAQAIRVYEDRQHAGTAKVKTRAEVNRTKKKVYKQKGTGGARHGARSAPIYVGGGVAHGPKGIKRTLHLPKKLKLRALAIAMGQKVKNGEVLAVAGLSKLKKTQEAKSLIKKLTKEGVKKITFVLSKDNLASQKVLRNLENVDVVDFKNLNAYKVFFGGILIFDKQIFQEKKVSKVAKVSRVSRVDRKNKK